MSLLDYLARDSQVQMAFLLMLGLCSIAFLINRRIMKAQQYDQEEKREQRRERYMAIERKSPPAPIVEHETE